MWWRNTRETRDVTVALSGSKFSDAAVAGIDVVSSWKGAR
jgi:hypothetical protein